MAGKTFRTVAELQAGPLSPRQAIVVETLAIMQRVVNRDKAIVATAADWAPFAALVDTARFSRIGNFGEEVDWDAYVGLLVQWANYSFWEGHVWRLRDVPATGDEPALVTIESEERIRVEGPVREGPYKTLPSIGVYAFDEDDRIISLHVYDQRPA